MKTAHEEAIEWAADAILELGPNAGARRQAETAVSTYMDHLGAIQDRSERDRILEVIDRAARKTVPTPVSPGGT